MATFSKILIANRGEIAVRVMTTAQRLGYRTVAVYSDADANARHVHVADEAVHIGPSSAAESYLSVEKILHAAKITGADAIHPGYGFLSENADFASACKKANIVFIGPSSEAITLMGSKRQSKIEMQAVGVPCVPGYQGDDQSIDFLVGQAKEIGTPLMVKASAGGGGRGMRFVNDFTELEQTIKSARSEAENAFGSGELILERAVMNPRHVEIQVFGDTHGNIIYLGERDCSVQRRHQKVIEEAPSSAVNADLRERMGKSAVLAAKSCNYVGAGTVEFLLADNGEFYFLEMNTRLQVEHPVTELITNVDLVEWQLLVASGQPLPLSQDEVQLSGHAMEVRLYAEDPANQFMPQTGPVIRWITPQDRDTHTDARIDHGVKEGTDVSPFYDPMLAKIIVWGKDRQEAIRKLTRAIQDTSLLGVKTNKWFLQNLVAHPHFTAGLATTAFIQDQFSDDESLSIYQPSHQELGLASALYHSQHSGKFVGWHSSNNLLRPIKLVCEGNTHELQLAPNKNNAGYSVTVGNQSETASEQPVQHEINIISVTDSTISYLYDGIRYSACGVIEGDSIYIDTGKHCLSLQEITHAAPASADGVGSGRILAPMDGAVIDLLCTEGEVVSKGQTLAVVEAMKMEHQIKADCSGSVSGISTSIGDQVKIRQVLVSIEPAEES
ncbi:3-methylcrotonyl-CoA carboxylase [Gammaproteobacteria bacterium 45_16_T64]|nr:3-methylcrotonyl-CoA carboxylase [Gammaproteobacteria bacterium 45_16_T64]